MTLEEKKGVARLKKLLSKHPDGCMLSNEQLLSLVRGADELAAIPGFLDEYRQKREAQSLENRARLKYLREQKKLRPKEWEELEWLLNEVWPKGS